MHFYTMRKNRYKIWICRIEPKLQKMKFRTAKIHFFYWTFNATTYRIIFNLTFNRFLLLSICFLYKCIFRQLFKFLKVIYTWNSPNFDFFFSRLLLLLIAGFQTVPNDNGLTRFSNHVLPLLSFSWSRAIFSWNCTN